LGGCGGGPGDKTAHLVADKKLFLWHEVLVLMDRSLLPEGRGSNCLSCVTVVGYNLSGLLQGPGREQVQEGSQIAANHPFSLPDADGGAEDGLKLF